MSLSVPAKLIAFIAALGVTFGAAALVGAAIDPTDEPAAEKAGHDAMAEDSAHAMADDSGHDAATEMAPGGLAVSQDGYTLEADRTFLPAGRTVPFRFRISDEQGRVVRDGFELEQTRELHLIVVRRDTAVFEHLHPTRDDNGTWTVAMNLSEPGVYRAYTDFQIDGQRHTLATDLFVPGDFAPKPFPPPATSARAEDTAGHQARDLGVSLEDVSMQARRESELTFAIDREGKPLEGLQPYLGAKGHLVALREGDLAYLHVHPIEAEGSGAAANEIRFMASFPSAGRYRLFLQFKTRGEVRVAPITVRVSR